MFDLPNTQLPLGHYFQILRSDLDEYPGTEWRVVIKRRGWLWSKKLVQAPLTYLDQDDIDRAVAVALNRFEQRYEDRLLNKERRRTNRAAREASK